MGQWIRLSMPINVANALDAKDNHPENPVLTALAQGNHDFPRQSATVLSNITSAPILPCCPPISYLRRTWDTQTTYNTWWPTTMFVKEIRWNKTMMETMMKAMMETMTMQWEEQRRGGLASEMIFCQQWTQLWQDETMQHNLPVRPTSQIILHYESNSEDLLQQWMESWNNAWAFLYRRQCRLQQSRE